MKKLFIIVCMIGGFFLLSSSIAAQGRAECDACGYCIGRTAPGNWESCRKCLYEGANTNPTSNSTLTREAAKGKYYTQLGCLDVGTDSFSNPSAPGGVLNFLLNRLIFPIVGVLSFISLIYGAFLLMTAQGSPEQVGRGKSYIVGALVGLLFTLSAILIINILAGDILRIPGFSRSLQGEVVVAATTATAGGKTVYPILGVFHNDKEIQKQTLTEKEQQINITVPISSSELSNTEALKKFTFRMLNDECYSRVAGRPEGPRCCDPEIAAGRPVCADSSYYGDTNLYISQISINGKRCTGYEHNGVAAQPVIGIFSKWTSVNCTSIES